MKMRDISVNYKTAVLIFLLLFFCENIRISAENITLKSEYSYRRFTTADGLPSMVMQSIIKDSKGLLWQGTYKGGASFDGFEFTPHVLDSFPNVSRIEEVNGQVRFIWENELIYPHTGKRVVLSDTMRINPHNSYSLPANYSIFENRKREKYFVKLENDSVSSIEYIPEMQFAGRCKIYFDLQKQDIYIPDNHKKTVNIYNLTTKTSRTIKNVLIECFVHHSRLGLLAIGNEGIYKVENDKAELYVAFRFEEQNKIAKETRNGDIYISDFSNIYRISGKKVEHLYHNSFITLWDVALDNDDNLWLATNKGLYNFFRFDFTNYHIQGHNIRTVTQDEKGTYWFAGDNEDIFKFSGGKLLPVRYPFNSKISTISFNFAFSHKNSTYFLTRDGVLIHTNGHFHWADLPVDNQYYGNIAICKGNLIVTGSNAVFEITPQGRVIRKYTDEELQDVGFRGLAVDHDNRIIVGGDESLSIIENGKISVYKNKNTIFSDIVCVDYGNHIFSAAKKYLNLIEGDSVKTIYTFENDYIMGLLPFDNEHMIISTLKGFYIFNSAKYFETGKVQLLFYNHENGMDGIEPQFSKMFLDHNRNVWMPTSEGIVHFNPNKLIRQIASPNLSINGIGISQDNVNWAQITKDSLTLNYKNNNIRFSYLGLCYSAADNVRYRYRLQGFQNEWSEPVKNREVTFNNLPPGNYIFEIYADAGTDESRSEIQSIAFTITPAFWQTMWFLVLCIALLIVTGAGIAIYVLQRKNKLILEKLRTEKELNELRISSIRLKAIPHFNANVLSVIEYQIANHTKEDAMRILGIYSDYTLKTLTELDKAARPLSEELAYVKMYLDLEKIRFRDKFDFQIEVDEQVDKNVQLPNMILHTYCENAVKHGLMPRKSGGQLSIKVSQHEQTVSVSVEDNGVGRLQAASKPQPRSTKMGLSILSRQIEIYNRFNKNKIVQHIDDLAVGTRFVVEVPLDFVYVG